MRVMSLKEYAEENKLTSKEVHKMYKNNIFIKCNHEYIGIKHILINDGVDDKFFKKCTKCKNIKELNNNNFIFRKTKSKDKTKTHVKYATECTKCYEDRRKKYYIENKDDIDSRNKEWSKNNKNRIREYRKENNDRFVAQRKEYLKNNPEINELYKSKAKEYKKEHEKEIKTYKKQYVNDNRDKVNENKRKYYQDNIEKIRAQDSANYFKNKKRENERNKIYIKNKRKNDPVFRLKQNVSSSVRNALKDNGSHKGGRSIWKYLPYTLIELKNHLESTFLPWMNWNNLGKYEADKWDDNDPSTWKWQVDHLKVHSEFNYSSMDSTEFLECWALSNLRAYPAKLNIIEGARMIRHTKPKKISKPKKPIKL